MDNKDGKKKESIDDILSDLNGLLNKMPSILDGIKMPDVKPAEFTPSAPPAAKKPEPETPAAPPDADKTVVLPAFNNLPEGAQEPGAGIPADAGEKTMIIENFSSVPEGGEAPAGDKLVPQSLGDFMFGENAQEHGPAAEPLKEEALPEIPALEPARAPEKAAPNPFETTRDFGGIPDIDALMQLSDSDLNGLSEAAAPAAPAPEPEPAPAAEPEPAAPAEIEPAAAPEPEKSQEPSMDELADFEKQLKAAVPQGGTMENKPEEEKPAPAPEAPAQEKTASPEIDFGSLTIEPEVQAQPAADEGLQIETAAQAAAPAPEPEGIQLEPQVQAAAEPQPEAPAASGGVELSIGGPAESTQQFGVPAESSQQFGVPAEAQPAAKAEETLSVGQPSGLVLEPASAAVSGAATSGDETLVVPPPSGSGDEEKTVIFEAGAAPGITSRSQAGDLAGLAERPVPEGIPADRVRSVSFLYSPEEKALCATVLSELDAICLKSGEKPMFIKRASVKECTPDMNANYIMQTVTDSGGQGLVCVGAIPQEKIYEVENTFTSSGGFFRHYDSASFTHSAALDLVLDLILR